MNSAHDLPALLRDDPELTRVPFDRFLTGDGRAAESYDDSCAIATPPSPAAPRAAKGPERAPG